MSSFLNFSFFNCISFFFGNILIPSFSSFSSFKKPFIWLFLLSNKGISKICTSLFLLIILSYSFFNSGDKLFINDGSKSIKISSLKSGGNSIINCISNSLFLLALFMSFLSSFFCSSLFILYSLILLFFSNDLFISLLFSFSPSLFLSSLSSLFSLSFLSSLFSCFSLFLSIFNCWLTDSLSSSGISANNSFSSFKSSLLFISFSLSWSSFPSSSLIFSLLI